MKLSVPGRLGYSRNTLRQLGGLRRFLAVVMVVVGALWMLLTPHDVTGLGLLAFGVGIELIGIWFGIADRDKR